MATLNDNTTIDITNDASTNWTSSSPEDLRPTIIEGTQGLYTGITEGMTADASVIVPGVVSPPVSVTIGTPLPVGTACPPPVIVPPTPAPTPAATSDP